MKSYSCLPRFCFVATTCQNAAVLYTTFIRFIIPSQNKTSRTKKDDMADARDSTLHRRTSSKVNSTKLSITRNANLSDPSSPEVVIEPLERVSNEGQAHLWALLLLNRASSGLLSLDQRCVVGLVNLIRGEVGRVDVGSEARLERRPNTAKTVKLDTAEE